MKKKTLCLTDAQVKLLIDALLSHTREAFPGYVSKPAIQKLEDSNALGAYLLGVLQRK